MNLEKERRRLEFKRVEMAMLEMEFKIQERLADIERLKENISNQQKRLDELKSELGD